MLDLALRGLIAGSLLVATLGNALGAPQSVPEPPAIQSEPYLRDCEGLLDAIQREDVERFLLGQVTSQGQALKLLADYGLIYSHEFKQALLLTVQQRGIQIPDFEIKDGKWKSARKSLVPFVDAIVKLAQATPQEFKAFVREVLVNFDKSAQIMPDRERQIPALIVHRFVSALLEIENNSVEPTLNVYVRSALLGTAKDLLQRLNRSRPEDWLEMDILFRRAMTTLVSALLGLVYIQPALNQWSESAGNYQDPEWHIYVSMLTGGVGGALLGWGWGRLSRRMHRKYLHAAKALPQVPELMVTFDDESQKTFMNSLLDEESTSLRDLAISMQQVCEAESVCQFTPVQLAYLGHLDLDQARGIGLYVESLLQNVGLGEKFGAIRAAAEKLRSNSGDYSAQVQFRQVVVTALSNTDKIEGAIRESLQKLDAKIQAMKQERETLDHKLYEYPAGQYSQELVAKNKILLHHLETDLADLDQVRIAREQILGRFDQLRPVLQRVKDSTMNTRGSPEMWRESANSVLIILDQM